MISASKITKNTAEPSEGKHHGTFFQPKTTVNKPNDIYEQEADSIADKVVQSKAISQSESFFKPAFQVQNKIQRQEREPDSKIDLDERKVLPDFFDRRLDWFEMSRPFSSRGAESYLHLDEKLHISVGNVWTKNYDFFFDFGFGDKVSADAANFFTPFTIDSALKRDFPTQSEMFERNADISSIVISPTVFTFDISDIPGTLRMPFFSIFGADKSNPYSKKKKVQRKCKECEEEDNVHRKDINSNEINTDKNFDSYVENLNSGGDQLSHRTRNYFEPRFGYDFSNVKIHNDSAAAKSAQSINSLAYTSGNNIVFNSGQYDPSSDQGKRLLAHELTHVVQQSDEKSVNRKIDPVKTDPSKQPDEITMKDYKKITNYECSLTENEKITAATLKVKDWLSKILTKLEGYIRSQEDEDTRSALAFHFHAADENTAIRVATVLDHINKNMIPNSTTTVLCGYSDGNFCDKNTIAVTLGSSVYFCPWFFNEPDVSDESAETIIHELAHTMYRGYYPNEDTEELNKHVLDDRAYNSFREYSYLSTNEALTNADSYSSFCLSLMTGSFPRIREEKDEMTFCDGDQELSIKKNLASVEKLNWDFINRLQDTRAPWWSIWETLRWIAFKGPDKAHAEPALKSASKLYEVFKKSNFKFNCLKKCPEIRSDFYVHTNNLYYSGISGDYIVCSGFFELSEETRIIKLYESLLETKGGMKKHQFPAIGIIALRVTSDSGYSPGGGGYTPDEAIEKMNLPPKKLPPVF